MGSARAQGQPPRILVGFPAGGSVDTTARRFADFARGRLAETVLVEQKVGAGGRIAIGALKDAAPDGQTLLLSPSSMFTIYPHAYRKLAYNAAADFTPVAPLAATARNVGMASGVALAVVLGAGLSFGGALVCAGALAILGAILGAVRPVARA